MFSKYVITALLLSAATMVPDLHGQDDQSCDNRRSFRGSNTWTRSHSDTDDTYSVIRFVRSTDDRCESAIIVGMLTYTPAEDDVVSMSFGSSATFRERTSSQDRAVSFTRGPDGQVNRQFQLNGRSASYDADAQRWLASFLPRVLASAGVNVKPRVARWRSQGGVGNALRNIETLGSSGAMRSHYQALLDGEKLTDEDFERTLRSVSENMRTSSGDLRSLLTRLAPPMRLSKRSVDAVEDAMMTMASSGDKAAVVQRFGQTSDRAMLMSVMRVTRTIPSSGDKAGVLRTLAARYLTGTDRELLDAYFEVARTIPSSGDLRNVLSDAVSFAPASKAVTRSIISAARNIASSGDRAAVLIRLTSGGTLSDKDLRDEFLRAASEIPSEGDRSRVLLAAARM